MKLPRKPQSSADITNWINLFIPEMLNLFSSLWSFTFNSFIPSGASWDCLTGFYISNSHSISWHMKWTISRERSWGWQFWLDPGMTDCPIQRTSLTTLDNYFRRFSSSLVEDLMMRNQHEWMNLNYMIIFCGS